MTEQEKILRRELPKDHIWEEANQLDCCPIELIEHCMSVYAKQEIESFFKWNIQQINKRSLDYLEGRRVDKKQDMQQFEKATILERYELYKKETKK